MKFTIKQKLIGSFVIVSLIFGIASFLSYTSMKDTNETYDYLIDTVAELRSISQSIEMENAKQVGFYRAFMLYEDETYLQKLNQSSENIKGLIEQGRKLSTLEETVERLDEILYSNQDFNKAANEIANSVSLDKQAALDRGIKEIVPLTNSLDIETKSFQKWLTTDILEKKKEETDKLSKASLFTVLIVSIVAALIAIASGFVISVFISRPIVKLGNLAKQVAAGDLRVEKLKLKSKDEVYYLNESFQQMTKNLREMIGGIADNSDQVAASAEQLNASSGQSSKAAEIVASSIQEVASSAEESTSKLESNSKALQEIQQGITMISSNSARVSELSKETTKEAEEGDQFVNDNLKQMRFIRESVQRSNEVIGTLSDRSNEIGNILNVINDIAEQTNLLALNAAIEAARAGEHGKGFAVVADEVRKLAEQSQDSTKSIAKLVADIQKDTSESVSMMSEVMKNAENGVQVSEQTSDKFSRILSGTKDIAPKIEEVTATVQQILASIEEVSTSAKEVAELSQTNAANSEEVAASTEEQLASMQEISASSDALASMAEDLKTIVNRFKY
ncbi:methyl-accepting chemotaxis protein [Aquibacillus kalidii]|uniref:methyl-accepting chemotaxis protein n=1 Tax=Aquibacillus kalidii TaxID=2762597 RepID=UPI0016478A08|nr:methyl-accepting chemotaxis protein [Aquibacillus kalidii]